MGLRDRLPRTEEAPHPQPQGYPKNSEARETPAEASSESSRNHPRRRATDFVRPATSILSMMASGNGPLPEDEVRDDHMISSMLPTDRSAVDSEGNMDSHHKPIISINGKDINDHDLGKHVA